MLDSEDKPKLKPEPTRTFEQLRTTAKAQDVGSNCFFFFKLAPEIRDMIYASAFSTSANAVVFWLGSQQRSGWSVGQWINPISEDQNTSAQIQRTQARTSRDEMTRAENITRAAALVSTCKQAYIEGLPYLYQDVVFVFHGLYEFEQMLDRIGLNGRQCLQHLDYYDPRGFSVPESQYVISMTALR